MAVVGGEFSLRTVVLVLALSVHGLFEGIAVGLQTDFPRLMHLFVAVLAHEVLVTFSVGVSLVRQRMRLRSVLQIAALFCLMIPVGMAIGVAVGESHSFAGVLASALLQGIAAGTFLYVIFLESLPVELAAAEDGLLKVLLLALGCGFVAALRFVVHDAD